MAEQLFARFDAVLRAKGWPAMGGQIVDARVIAPRRPRLSQAEQDTIKGGAVPAAWKPARRAQIDRDVARGNATRARVRSRAEHVFAAQKCRLGLVVRTVGRMRARVKIGLANLAYNFSRLAWLQAQTAPEALPPVHQTLAACEIANARRRPQQLAKSRAGRAPA